jgi:2-C-methyl-D-erythritol 4-phosphate cytidylyltransferase/2-C-methyl-D-erythritol 2,4-cyclodiphosphate synthase
MPVGVIIVAAGRGERLGGRVPKQLLEIDGRSIVARSVAAFDASPDIDHLVVVLPAALVADGPSIVGSPARPCTCVAGGERRQDSVRRGLEAMPASADVVLIHDAARPFVSGALIGRVIAAAREAGAVVPAVRARDTVKRVPAGSATVAETVPRDEIWLAQTPQGFTRAVLEDAVALGATVEATDEAALAERSGHPVRVVEGDETNVKITTPADLADARARATPAPRVGTGYDLHRLVDGRPLVLAGVVVPGERGPMGHSDGDVVCHAIVDALLGAAGAGDIGRHFPDSDARWKGAPGLDLLARAVAIVAEAGWQPANVDVTVVLERPKLGPHVAAIRAALANVLGLTADAVSVKAKTNEGVDAIGRGEAVAAHAVAALRRAVPA